MGNSTQKFSAMITGATGMVGEGVMLECLKHPSVERVLIVNRKPYPLKHPKLEECIIPNFLELDAFTQQLTGYDACFYCAGVSSVGISEADYVRITYDVTMHFARTVAHLNPRMTFDFVTGARTDSSEQGKVMWARVKGKTENALMKLPFKGVYNFRPGFMKPMEGQRNIKTIYKIAAILYPLLHLVLPNQASTMSDVGLAMINTVLKGYPKQILEIQDINTLAKA
ncbi:MAG TPA: NAD-dependent epimerase/dehydratase family protein [Bryobacteraceae bacterium]|jgi:uncharacterized protein YbjT (DUF2867 family)